MRICFIAGTLGRGGAEKQLVCMLKALAREHVACRVLCLTSGEAYERDIRELGVTIEYVGGDGSRLLRIRKIAKSVRAERPDIVQSAHFYTNIYAALAGRFASIPSIGAVRNDLVSEIAANGAFGKWQFRLPTRLIVNSERALERAIALGRSSSRIDFVRNVVEAQKATPVFNRGDAPLNILFVGRLVEQKRPEWFIRLAEKLRGDFPDRRLEFRVAGDGRLRPQLEQSVRESKLLNGEFKFLGERAEMSAEYEAADMIVSTSRHEGTPNAILEAMSHGVPVIATDVGGVSEIIDERRGLLVDASNFDELVAAASTLIKNERARRDLGQAGMTFVKENHSLSYLQTRLREIYCKAMRAT